MLPCSSSRCTAGVRATCTSFIPTAILAPHGRFRKARTGCEPSQLVENRQLRGNSRTCFEGPSVNSSGRPAPWPRSILSGSRPNIRMTKRICFTKGIVITTLAREGGFLRIHWQNLVSQWCSVSSFESARLRICSRIGVPTRSAISHDEKVKNLIHCWVRSYRS